MNNLDLFLVLQIGGLVLFGNLLQALPHGLQLLSQLTYYSLIVEFTLLHFLVLKYRLLQLTQVSLLTANHFLFQR